MSRQFFIFSCGSLASAAYSKVRKTRRTKGLLRIPKLTRTCLQGFRAITKACRAKLRFRVGSLGLGSSLTTRRQQRSLAPGPLLIGGGIFFAYFNTLTREASPPLRSMVLLRWAAPPYEVREAPFAAFVLIMHGGRKQKIDATSRICQFFILPPVPPSNRQKKGRRQQLRFRVRY